MPEAEETQLSIYQPEKTNPVSPPSAPLLPKPFASIVSAATTCFSLSIRTGGFFGRAAIRGARIGTLTSFELGRVILEGILTRAGQDVVDSSTGNLGIAAAESILRRALSSLHYTITHTSFLISAGFEIGSTSVSSSIAIADYFLSAINAIFGDTETSKAIATIIVLVQREFSNPETGINGEKVGLADLWVGAVGFGLLQRWGQVKTDDEIKAYEGEVVVWDIVVLDGIQPIPPELDTADEEDEVEKLPLPRTAKDGRPTSFVSATGNDTPFETFANDDGISFVSATSSRPTSAGNDLSRSEQAFKQYLLDQVRPGTKVQITAQSVTTNSVTVEILGDSNIDIHPPHGYSLVTEQSQNPLDRTIVFQNKKRRFRRGSFEVEQQPETGEHLSTPFGSSAYPSSPPPGESATESGFDYLEFQAQPSEDQDGPVVANQSRPRMPPATRPDPPHVSTLSMPDRVGQNSPPKPKKRSFKSPLKRGASYKNLVDFWKDRDRTPKPTINYNGNEASGNVHQTSVEPIRTPLSNYVKPSQTSSTGSRPTLDSMQSFQRTSSLRKHRRGTSSVCTVTSSTSETSLVLRDNLDATHEDRVVSALHRDGYLPETYPRGLFVDNVSRFARFALASYGSRFLRLTGAVTDDDQMQLVPDAAHPAAHHSFSTYTRLPPSTVLLSSFVDPQGGTNAAGETETGMPLVHYISLDHDSKSVVLTCRGTLGFEDVLTDMSCDYEDFNWRGRVYQVHKGMLASARRLMTLHGGRVIATIKAALEEFEDYGLVLCGHSLGGSVAAILAILLSQPNTTSSGGSSAFVTSSIPTPKLILASLVAADPSFCYLPPTETLSTMTLPANRPIHVYALGPAACVSEPLQRATRGLITTIIHGQDCVPYLSLGTLRDHQAVSLAFKTDSKDAKGELRRRVWESIRKSFTDRTGLGEALGQDWWGIDDEEDDQWPWAALKSLRATMIAQKLLPPGEVYTIASQSVLQRHAFVKTTAPVGGESDNNTIERSFKPATHVKLTHVRDVGARFGELRLGASMFTDHIPARYERAVGILQKGLSG